MLDLTATAPSLTSSPSVSTTQYIEYIVDTVHVHDNGYCCTDLSSGASWVGDLH